MSYPIENKVVIITGASSGIGRETALAFAQEKAIVVLAARREDKLLEIASQIQNNGGQVLIVKTDVSKLTDVENLIKTTIDRFNRIDILVNNAGWGIHASVKDTPIQDMKDIFDTNLMGPFYTMKSVLPIMKNQKSGHIINVASVIGRRGMGMSGAYCSTKFALIGLTESLQVELHNKPIHASIVCPGLTNTDFGVNMREPVRTTKKNIWENGVPSAKVAHAIVRCAQKPKREVYITWYDHAMVYVNTLFPGFIEYLLTRYRGK